MPDNLPGLEGGTEADNLVIAALYEAHRELTECKPRDRSGRDRVYAVTKTRLEEVIAFFGYWVVRADE